jgi:transcription initiation factor TFIIH subunit 2
LLKEFIFLYFDSNPISQIGIIITRKKRVEKISELAGNPRAHVALLEQLKYQECEGEASVQNALDMGLQTLK